MPTTYDDIYFLPILYHNTHTSDDVTFDSLPFFPSGNPETDCESGSRDPIESGTTTLILPKIKLKFYHQDPDSETRLNTQIIPIWIRNEASSAVMLYEYFCLSLLVHNFTPFAALSTLQSSHREERGLQQNHLQVFFYLLFFVESYTCAQHLFWLYELLLNSYNSSIW
jgi:hypothetical protein